MLLCKNHSKTTSTKQGGYSSHDDIEIMIEGWSQQVACYIHFLQLKTNLCNRKAEQVTTGEIADDRITIKPDEQDFIYMS